jgi:hypothetical protein
MSNINLENFITEKIANFILYSEKTIGKNNKLYPQITQLTPRTLISYAAYLQKACSLNKETGKYEMPEKTVREYLSSNGITDFEKLDDGNYLKKVTRYLEMFVNLICK